VLEIGDRDVDNILQFSGDTEIIDNLVSLFDEGLVNVESLGRVRFGHLEVVL